MKIGIPRSLFYYYFSDLGNGYRNNILNTNDYEEYILSQYDLVAGEKVATETHYCSSAGKFELFDLHAISGFF